MKILSLNVNQFAGSGNPNTTSGLKELNVFAKEIICLIKGFLMGNDTGIVVLQEVPCRDSIYSLFHSAFSENDYKIFEPLCKQARFVTLALASKESDWKLVEDGLAKKTKDYQNRIIEVHNNSGLYMLGVHMPYNPKDEKDIKKFWGILYTYLNNNPNTYILAGDFNANEVGCYKDQYKNILDIGYEDIIPEGSITYRAESFIDHFLIPKNIQLTKSKVWQNDFSFSDHAIMVTDEFEFV